MVSFDKFDPRALERGAEALKLISKSDVAKETMELLLQQETSKQQEHELKKQEALNQSLKNEREHLRMMERERRVTQGAIEEEKRKTLIETRLQDVLSHKDKLKNEAKNARLVHDQAEALAKKTHAAEFRRKKEMLALEHEKAKELRKIDVHSHKKMLKNNLEIEIQRFKEMGESRKESMEHSMNKMKVQTKLVLTALKDRRLLTGLSCSLGLIGATLFASKYGFSSFFDIVKKRATTPALVSDTNRISLMDRLMLRSFNKLPANLPTPIFETQLQTRLEWSERSVKSCIKSGDPFPMMLLSGPPGTGKTLWAKTLASKLDMDYAILAGGDVIPLGEQSSTALRDSFRMAGKRKLLLVIDECDACLSKRNPKDPISMSFLSTFLSLTGASRSDVCVVLTTNRKSFLDNAILDRVSDNIVFPNPEFPERLKLMEVYRDIILGRAYSISPLLQRPAFWSHYAHRMAGASSRKVMQFITQLDRTSLGSGADSLTPGLVEIVFDWHMRETSSSDGIEE